MPDPRSVFRLVALAGFLLLVAVGLWLLDAGWPVIVAVMAAAWALAALVEWAAWRQERLGDLVVRREAASAREPAPPPPLVEPHAAGPASLLPPEPEEEAAPSPPQPEPVLAPRPGPARVDEPLPEPEREAPRPVPARPPLRPVPAPPPAPPPLPVTPPPAARAPQPAPPSGVVDLRHRATAQARRWNLWDLESLARDELQGNPERFRELSYLFVHLRQFASADGSLPTEFDPLVRESLGDLLDQRR